MTKIDIFSGFLGAGKTTLIKKLIQEAYQGEKLVLIENEFGEIGIDGGFLKDAGVEITEMNSGCICCSLVGDFGQALEQVLFQFHPDRILIEPSGVGKLSDVIGAVQRLGQPRHRPQRLCHCGRRHQVQDLHEELWGVLQQPDRARRHHRPQPHQRDEGGQTPGGGEPPPGAQRQRPHHHHPLGGAQRPADPGDHGEQGHP